VDASPLHGEARACGHPLGVASSPCATAREYSLSARDATRPKRASRAAPSRPSAIDGFHRSRRAHSPAPTAPT
jgi:hypothetical protein